MFPDTISHPVFTTVIGLNIFFTGSRQWCFHSRSISNQSIYHPVTFTVAAVLFLFVFSEVSIIYCRLPHANTRLRPSHVS